MFKSDNVRQLRILIVEYHPFQLVALEMQLNQLECFTLTPISDCAQALSLIKSGCSYDVLLCDQHLPDGLGINLIEQAFQLKGIRHAILFSSIEVGWCPADILRDAQKANLPLRACLSKPLGLIELQEALRFAWDGADY